MEPSPAVAVPGLRTIPRLGWRSEIGAAIALVARRPPLWLLGSAGFALRGGIVLLILPILVFPTQVEVRFMLGNNLSSTGLTSGFWSLLAVGAALGAVLALGALYALAKVEVTAFEAAAAPLSRSRTRRLTSAVFVVQLAALIALTACAVPVVLALASSTISELTNPTSSDSIYLRVLADVRGPLAIGVVALILIELFSAAATREILVRDTGRRGGSLRRSPFRTLTTALLGWSIWLAAVGAVGWLLGLAWQMVTSVFLSTTSLGDVARDFGLVVVGILLAGVFVLGLIACGVVSAFRSALWTIEGLR